MSRKIKDEGDEVKRRDSESRKARTDTALPLPLLPRASPEIQLAVERGGRGELDTLCTRGHVHVVAGGRRWGSKEVAEKEVCREIGGGGGG